MRKLFSVIALSAAVGVVSAAEASAQVRFGVQGSFADDTDFGIGVRVRGDTPRLIPNAPLSLIGSFDWFFPDAPSGVDATYFELNGNVVYNFTITGSVLRPYAGGGLNIARASVDFGQGNISDTNVGLNLLGGLNFRTAGRIQPFVELRLELEGGEQFVITGGIHF